MYNRTQNDQRSHVSDRCVWSTTGEMICNDDNNNKMSSRHSAAIECPKDMSSRHSAAIECPKDMYSESMVYPSYSHQHNRPMSGHLNLNGANGIASGVASAFTPGEPSTMGASYQTLGSSMEWQNNYGAIREEDNFENIYRGNKKIKNYRPDIDLRWREQDKVDTRFFTTPKNVYNEFVNTLGEPDAIDKNSGGLAIWNKKSLKRYKHIQKIELVDLSSNNNFPFPHSSSIKLYISLYIQPKKRRNVLSVSGDIMYDNVSRILIVSGMSLEYCMMLAKLIRSYVYGYMTWNQVMEEKKIRVTLEETFVSNVKPVNQ